jgi:hypothetical protein
MFWDDSFHPAYQQSSIQSDKYQVLHRYSYFSWWWALSRLKHVEKRNKHTKKTCAPSWLYLQDYTGIHRKQNIKFGTNIFEWMEVNLQALRTSMSILAGGRAQVRILSTVLLGTENVCKLYKTQDTPCAYIQFNHNEAPMVKVVAVTTVTIRIMCVS